MCRDVGVQVGAYLSDNGSAYTSEGFQEHLSTFRQVHDFAAPGAHHHNAVAESNIRVITSMARAIMLHAGIHWQEQADPALWPMAVAHAVYLHNHVPREDTGLSPYDMFT